MDIVERLRWRSDAEAEALETMDEAATEIERLRAELLEQARIIGMSGERELALRAELDARDAPTGTAIAYLLASERSAKNAVNEVLEKTAEQERAQIANWLRAGGFVRDWGIPWREQLAHAIQTAAYKGETK